MAKKYLTPDFDVTAYDIKDILAYDGEIGPGDTDDGFGVNMSFQGDLEI